MSRSSTPGSPAGRHAGPHGNRARSFDYPEADERDEVALDPALVTSPGHGRVGVFQPPRPAPPRGQSAGEQPASTIGDGGDIDSPFLDLFGGAQPGGRHPAPPALTRTPEPPATEPAPVVAPPRRGVGRETLPIPHQHVAPAEPAPPAERRPAADRSTARLRTATAGTPPVDRPGDAVDVVRSTPRAPELPDDAADRVPALDPAPSPPGRNRVPHQPGDRLPALRPTADPEQTDPGAEPPLERPARHEPHPADRAERRADAERLAAPGVREVAAPTTREVATPPAREVATPRQRSAAERNTRPAKPVRVRPRRSSSATATRRSSWRSPRSPVT